MALLQQNRLLVLATPLGEDEIVLTSFRASEGISQLCEFQLEMLSDNNSIAASDIVGRNVTFGVKRDGGKTRYFNGFVSQFAAGDEKENRREYRAKVVPWLWFLTRTSDCRIFQEMTVPDIIEKIFKDLGFQDYALRLSRPHAKREYCVQFRESDFNFVSRLMEEEGIFYYFRHQNGKHTLHVADHATAYDACDEYEVNYPTDTGARAIVDHLTGWEHRYEFRSGKFSQADYNFELPGVDLTADSSTVVELPNNKAFEFYEFPGRYSTVDDGRALADVRMEEEEVEHDIVYATSRCRTFAPGGMFEVKRHRCGTERNKAFVITRIEHVAIEPMAYESGTMVADDYSNSFTCIPDSVVFRPARTTRRPLVQGIQSAIVVGPRGEEIFCDKYGRVKVQFHWDREGKLDEKSSCWIRVAHNIAGRHWGCLAIPRIGQEVVVDFLDGDPDRPLIIGCVYNADQMPHYELPHEMTKSYLKTNSTKGGSGYNEIRFEDKAGKEQMFLHAEKDMDLRVKDCSREYVGGDRHVIVKANQKEKVDADKHSHVKGKYLGKVGGDHSLQVGQKRHTKVGMVDATEAGQEIHLKAGMKVVIEAGMQISLVGPGGFVDIGPAGVTIQGTTVKINSGGSAGSGSGAKPESPQDPVEADDSKTGRKSS